MGTVISANTPAATAQRHTAAAGSSFGRSVERLSSGLRINRAADDAAGMVMSERLRADIRGYTTAARGIQDALGVVRAMDAGWSEMQGMVQRIRELTVQRQTGTLAPEDTAAIDLEIDAIGFEVDRLLSTSDFNGKKLYVPGDLWIQLSGREGDQYCVNIEDPGGPYPLTHGISLPDLDAWIADIGDRRWRTASYTSTLEHAMATAETAVENLSAAESRIRDLDVAKEMVDFTKSQILQQAGVSVLAQANQAPAAVLRLLR